MSLILRTVDPCGDGGSYGEAKTICICTAVNDGGSFIGSVVPQPVYVQAAFRSADMGCEF